MAMVRGRMRDEKRRIDKIIGTNIRNMRISIKMSRDEMAELLDLTVSHLGLIERGERGATLVVLSKLSKAFDQSISDFFQESDKKGRGAKPAESTEDLYRKRIGALVSQLSEPGLAFITAMLQELNIMRNESDPTSN